MPSSLGFWLLSLFERSHYTKILKEEGGKEYEDKEQNKKKKTHKKKNIEIKVKGNRQGGSKDEVSCI